MTSPAEGRVAAAFGSWNARLPGAGEISFAAFWLSLGSGVLLSLPYDSAAAADSLQLLLLGNPAGVLVRGLHYWSAQFFLGATAFHLIEHLARGSEGRVRFGTWLRLVLSTVVTLYLMVSGYVLKGDAEGLLARQVMAGLLAHLPLVGGCLRQFLVGPEETLRVLYLQHAATASLLSFAFIVEHFRLAWPSARAWLASLTVCAPLAFVFPPALHDPSNPVVKGPWYLLGVQEMLHWLGAPGLAWLPAGAALVALAALPVLRPAWRGGVKAALAMMLGGYLVLTGVGHLLRGANWEWLGTPHGSATFADPRVFFPDAKLAHAEVPVVRGRREGCLVCHTEVRGIEAAHAPQALGCASCHLGQTWSGHKGLAHSGMVRVPGNLSTARTTCGASGCHGPIVERVDRSPMANGPGLVGVDRFAFAEAPTPDAGGTLRRLGGSPADRHLAELCAGCHLAVDKERPGPIDDRSRGGGCTACHLNYHRDPKLHPTLTLAIGDEHCFGCHSRSGRISTTYAGWHETERPAASAAGRADLRLLSDGRVFERRPADVHHEAGLACVDCHTAQEAMGDGRDHRHEEEALEVACADCHLAAAPATKSWNELDVESQAIVRLRTSDEPRDRRFLISGRSGRPLVNAFLDAAGRPVLQGKLDSRRHPLKPPSPACTGLGHDRVSCSACHSAWAAQCLRCHTQRGTDAEWHEFGGDFRAELPSLGVRGAGEGRIVPFAPGMILTLGSEPVDLARAFPPALALQGHFQRLFAPVEPHSTARAGRSCVSCHAEPLAIGVGRGRLRLERGGDARWLFSASAEPARDGLPADAWTGFLGDPRPRTSTRGDARPFTAAEQRRVLRVGACLTCHPPTARNVERIYARFDRALERVSRRCIVPWRGSATPGAVPAASR